MFPGYMDWKRRKVYDGKRGRSRSEVMCVPGIIIIVVVVDFVKRAISYINIMMHVRKKLLELITPRACSACACVKGF